MYLLWHLYLFEDKCYINKGGRGEEEEEEVVF
jgi:hypothetical protein